MFRVRHPSPMLSIVVMALLAGVLPASLVAAEGVYLKSQARSGEGLYEQHCLVCHDKKYFREVLQRWNGQPMADFFDVMSSSMPESNPGGLLDEEYLALLAYLLSRSRFPVGSQPLEMEDLGMLTIEHP
jgi:mono/diheme cytochrome c family protein